MSYHVVWKREALSQLAALLTAADDLPAVEAASVRIAQRLEADPTTAGEQRPRHRRLLFDPPLGVVFEVDELTREVLVLSVGWSGRPG